MREGDERVITSVWLPRSLKKRLETIAKEEYTSVSAVVRRLLLRSLEELSKENGGMHES